MKKYIFAYLLLISAYNCFAQKTAELEYYTGKTKNYVVRLALVKGNISATEIFKTNLKSNKTTKYTLKAESLGDSSKNTFLPIKSDSTLIRKRDNFQIKGLKNKYEVLQKSIKVVYGFDLSTYTIKLQRETN